MNLMNNEKHYNTLSNYYKYKYNNKVSKISLNASFSCPNKDGTKGYGGCTYCSKLGSGDFAGDKSLSIEDQFKEIKAIMDNKWPNAYYIPYFQANSNTYASVEKLREIYEQAIFLDKKIVMLSLATRPDCLPTDVVEYLSVLNKKIPLQIELGLQTIHEETAKLINRGDTLEEFENAVKSLRKANIEVVVHIINGLPYETKDMMLKTASYLNKFDIQGVKIHNLMIIKDTKMANDFIEKPFSMLSRDEYVEIVAKQLQLLNPNFIIHRLEADASKDDLIEPKWCLKKLVVINEIDKYMRSLNIYQGDLYKGHSE